MTIMARLPLRGGGDDGAEHVGQDKSPYRPFKKYIFYLDLRCMPQLRPSLTQYIHAFGGKIEEFFSRKVKYLVTDKPKKDWPSKDELETELGQGDEDNANKCQPNANKVELVSRGKLLLSKAAPGPSTPLSKVTTTCKTQTPVKKPTTTDVLQLARASNVKILQAFDLKYFCESHSQSHSNQVADKSKIVEENVSRLNAVEELKVSKFEGHYLKIEDNQQRFRPIYKEFQEWPEINFDSANNVCPFSKKKANTQTQQQANHGTNETNNKTFEGLALHHNKHLMAANHAQVQQQSFPQTNKQLEQQAQRREEPIKKLFCEICQEYFSNLVEHLKTKKHKEYVENESNFDELRNVVESVQGRFNNEIESRKKSMSRDNDSSDEEGDDEEEGDYEDLDEDVNAKDDQQDGLFSPFSSQRNSNKTHSTIQLSGSKHTSHFVALHDLVPSPVLASHNRSFFDTVNLGVDKKGEDKNGEDNKSQDNKMKKSNLFNSSSTKMNIQDHDCYLEEIIPETPIKHDTVNDKDIAQDNNESISESVSETDFEQANYIKKTIAKNISRILNGFISPTHDINCEDNEANDASTDYSPIIPIKRSKFD